MSIRDLMIGAATFAKRSELLDVAVRYNPVVRPRVERVARRFDMADREGRRVLTERMTARVLAAAVQTRYGSGRGLRFDDWPIVPKLALRDDMGAFCRRTLLTIPAATGGTTGTPLRLVRSLTSIAAEQVFLDRLVGRHGLDWRTARIAVLRADAVGEADRDAPPYGFHTHGGRRLVLSGRHLSTDTLPWYLAALGRFRPDLLWVFPTTAAALLRLGEAAKVSWRVPLVLSSSEYLDPWIRAGMETGWGATVIDYYGLAERVAFAPGFVAGQYVFDPAYGRTELLEVPDTAAGNGHREVAIIATGYWNTAMPLLRYDTGDRALVPEQATQGDLEAIVLGLQPFAGIAGRTDSYVFAPDGRRLSGIDQLPREVDNLLQIQIVQDDCRSITIRAVVRPGFGPTDQARLEANARVKLLPGMTIRVEVVPWLERTAQGKTPYIIRRVGMAMS